MSEKDKEYLDALLSDIEVLRGNLIDARTEYTADNSVNDRLAAAKALHAINQFLQGRCRADDIPADTLVPLSSLMSALADIEYGRDHPLLRPVKGRAGRPKNPQHYVNVMATASAAVTFLMDGPYNEEKAAREVARLMNLYGLAMPEGTSQSQWKKITAWRDKLDQGEHGKEALEIRNHNIDLFRSQTKISAENILKIVFSGLAVNTT